MDIRHLRYFLAVADELHFRRAAERLHITQPPLSARIRDLERELGVRLFHRGGGEPVRLTAAGRELLPWATEIVEHVKAAQAAVAQAAHGVDGGLAVGVAPGTPGAMLSRAIRAFRGEHAAVTVTMCETSGAQGLDALADGALDVVVVRHVGPLDVPSGSSIRLCDEPFGVACLPEHPLADEPSVDPPALAGNRVVCVAEAIAPLCSAALVDFCHDEGVSPEDVCEAVEPCSLVRPMSAASPRATVALVPAGDAGVDKERLAWRPLGGGRLAMSISAVTDPPNDGGAAIEFVAALADAAGAVDSLTAGGALS